MGNTYANVTLQGAGRAEAIAALRECDCDAFMSPTINGVTVVYPDNQGVSARDLPHAVPTVRLTRQLSGALHCAALGVSNSDDDLLHVWLSVDGAPLLPFRRDMACSPGKDDVARATDFAASLCQAFSRQAMAAEVIQVLAASPGLDDPNDAAIRSVAQRIAKLDPSDQRTRTELGGILEGMLACLSFAESLGQSYRSRERRDMISHLLGCVREGRPATEQLAAPAFPPIIAVQVHARLVHALHLGSFAIGTDHGDLASGHVLWGDVSDFIRVGRA